MGGRSTPKTWDRVLSTVGDEEQEEDKESCYSHFLPTIHHLQFHGRRRSGTRNQPTVRCKVTFGAANQATNQPVTKVGEVVGLSKLSSCSSRPRP